MGCIEGGASVEFCLPESTKKTVGGFETEGRGERPSDCARGSEGRKRRGEEKRGPED